MTPDQLARATGARFYRAVAFCDFLNVAMALYGIDTPKRQAAFCAQIGHETAGLRYVEEIWGPTEQQERYEPPSELAERLGNEFPGDGERYKGHGLIQVTGRANHRRARNRLQERFPNVPDFEAFPDQLCDPYWASLSACDYWDEHGLNELADIGDMIKITKRINGGKTGLKDRLARWDAAKIVFA
jgi:putative chitinase